MVLDDEMRRKIYWLQQLMQQLELETRNEIDENTYDRLFILPKNFTSSKEPGGGNGKPLLVGNRMGTRPVPSVFIGNKPGGAGGGRSDAEARAKFGDGKRPNGDGRFNP